MDSTAYLATDLELDRYVYNVCGNWDNYEPDDEIVASNEKNDEKTKDIKGPPNNLYALYNVYN